MQKLRIAMIGQKGIPARYGGVETHVEKIALRLAKREHEVWAFCRKRFIDEKQSLLPAPDSHYPEIERRKEGLFYENIKLLSRSSINTKHLDAATHSLFCALEAAVSHGFDIVHFHGIGPSAFTPIPRILGRTVVSTIHALDWRQSKWGNLAKWALKNGEKIGVASSTGVIAVSKGLVDYLGEIYGIKAKYIPNGAEPAANLRPPRLIRQFRLEGDDYILTVGRIIRDRGLHHLIRAFNKLKTNLKLVIVGAESPRTSYSDELDRMAGEKVIFTGNLFGEILEELYSNCKLFVLASSVEGLPITVCEAMAHSRGMLLSDINENIEVAGDAANYYKCGDGNELHDKLKALVEDIPRLRKMGEIGLKRVKKEYNWDDISRAVEEFYYELISR